MNDDMMDLDDDALVKTIFDTIERQTGYRHYQQRIGNPILSNAIVFYGKCIQRPDTQHPLNPNDRRRNVVSMPTYDCRGEITGHIHRDQNWIQLTIDHHQNHQPQPTQRVFLTNEEVDFLSDNATTMTTPELYRTSVQRFGNHITRAQVYHWRLDAVQGEYLRDNDQFVSARALLNEWNDCGFEEVR
ncbi:hypothetical protein [Absidia glauca]|uniref:Uncharacterized protein n=1 Tax=Absidia glauca TaxID=4829 RepID=A0A163JF36_ABSGL|nr:hypothetical protein [Absidia glauca]